MRNFACATRDGTLVYWCAYTSGLDFDNCQYTPFGSIWISCKKVGLKLTSDIDHATKLGFRRTQSSFPSKEQIHFSLRFPIDWTSLWRLHHGTFALKHHTGSNHRLGLFRPCAHIPLLHKDSKATEHSRSTSRTHRSYSALHSPNQIMSRHLSAVGKAFAYWP